MLSQEQINKINTELFSSQDFDTTKIDLCLVLGSLKCEYRIQKALEVFSNNSGLLFLLSGGNQYNHSSETEAQYMKSFLIDHKIDESSIFLENNSISTFENLEFSLRMINDIQKEEKKHSLKVAIVSAGFHLKRVKLLINKLNTNPSLEFFYLPAYGPNTNPTNWYLNPIGEEVILNEMIKLATL